MAELHTAYPLFPGENEREQLACMMEIKGSPPQSMIEASPKKKLLFDEKGNPTVFINSMGKKRIPNTRKLQSIVRTNDLLFLNFLKGCIEWDPRLRMTPE